MKKAQDDIESRIADFEQTLAMPCPLCSDGRIEEKTTDKGKVFYSCSQKDCRFVSWDKPYHFECPLCKNPYLIEFITPAGTPGLKCPRASCTYSQDNLLTPVQHMAATAAPADTPPKKKKLVRRVKRRRWTFPRYIKISFWYLPIFLVWFYKKVCVTYTDLSTFVVGWAWVLMYYVNHGCYRNF